MTYNPNTTSTDITDGTIAYGDLSTALTLDNLATNRPATASITANTNKITNVSAPTTANDAATKTYVDKRDLVKLTGTTASMTTATLTNINLATNTVSTDSGNTALNTQIVTATPTNGGSIANGFVQVKQACWIHISGLITWPSASTTGNRWTHIRHYSPTGGANYLVNFYTGMTTPSANLAETPLLGAASFASTVSMHVYAAQYDFFNLWGFHTQGTSITPLTATLTFSIVSFT